MHVRSRKPLQDVLTAVRLGKPVAQCGFGLQPNAEAHLRRACGWPALSARAAAGHTLVVAARCTFSLDELRYQYPHGNRAARHHARADPAPLTYEGMQPSAIRRACRPAVQQVEHELALIAELRYEMYFLTVHDIVRFARSERHPVPGPGLGGQFGGLLLPGRDRGGPDAHECAVRALHQPRAQRAARHRRGLRAPAPRGGHPVHLHQVRPRARRHHRRGHQLPHPQRHARRGQGAGPRRADRRASPRSTTGSTTAWPPSSCSACCELGGPRRPRLQLWLDAWPCS
jgi:hypothetical protein